MSLFWKVISESVRWKNETSQRDLFEYTHKVLAGGAGAIVTDVCVTTLITVVVLRLLLAGLLPVRKSHGFRFCFSYLRSLCLCTCYRRWSSWVHRRGSGLVYQHISLFRRCLGHGPDLLERVLTYTGAGVAA